jgi:transposase
VISTVTNKGTMRWKIFDGALNADILIDFLKRLVRDVGRRVYLILDNLRVHHSKPVKAWLAEHKHEIEVFYPSSTLPATAPS